MSTVLKLLNAIKTAIGQVYLMGRYLETFRGWVTAWECDTAEHFTTVYYFDRFSQATIRMLAALGYAPGDPALPRTRDCYVRY